MLTYKRKRSASEVALFVLSGNGFINWDMPLCHGLLKLDVDVKLMVARIIKACSKVDARA